MSGKIDIEEEIERILAAPLYKPSGEYVPEEEHSKHHFIDSPTERCVKCIINFLATTEKEADLLKEIDCDKNIHITKDIHELLNRFFKKSLLPHEILSKVDSIFNMECYGINKEKLMKKLDVVALCSYARRYKELRTFGTKKLGDVREILIKKVDGNFKTKEILTIFGITTNDVKIFLENYFIYPNWRDFYEQWEIIARNRDKIISQNNGSKKTKSRKRERNLRKDNSIII